MSEAMRTFEEAVAYIHDARGNSKKEGLSNTRLLLSLLSVPDTPVPLIHVAGTNGKGSVCAMLESALRAAGYRTGLYTSPFLRVYNERVRVDGRAASDEALLPSLLRVIDAAETLRARGVFPTPFEMGTAAAFDFFRREKVDIAVIEVGLGGRLDPTNVVTPLVSVIASIGLDHTQILGDTIEQIAFEKAGIIKAGVPVVLQPVCGAATAVIRRIAAERGAPLTALSGAQVRVTQTDARGFTADFAERREGDGAGDDACNLAGNGATEAVAPSAPLTAVRVPLAGAHQALNALTAFAALRLLPARGFPMPDAAIRAGLSGVRWSGRLEWVDPAQSGLPCALLLDGAHNAQGARALSDFIGTCCADRRRVLLFGVLKEKLTPDMLATMAALSDDIVTVTPPCPRALPASELAESLRAPDKRVFAADSLQEGLRRAAALAGADGLVVAAGSLYLIGALMSLINVPA